MHRFMVLVNSGSTTMLAIWLSPMFWHKNQMTYDLTMITYPIYAKQHTM